MDKYITDVVQVYLSIFYFLIPLSYKSKYLSGSSKICSSKLKFLPNKAH